MLDKTLRKQLGHLLWLERCNQNHNLLQIANKLHISALVLDHVERGAKNIRWRTYQRLLDIYGKEIKIKFIDKKINDDLLMD